MRLAPSGLSLVELFLGKTDLDLLTKVCYSPKALRFQKPKSRPIFSTYAFRIRCKLLISSLVLCLPTCFHASYRDGHCLTSETVSKLPVECFPLYVVCVIVSSQK